MKKTILSVCIAIGCSSAYGVNVNHDGLGEVLIYPYYTAQAGQKTLMSIVNITDQHKIVKVQFREGVNSREVLNFNVYLSPYDVWVASIQEDPEPCGGNFGEAIPPCSDEKTPGNVFSPDGSCAFGDIASFGTQGKDFVNFDYSGVNADSGSIALSRSREGYILAFDSGWIDKSAPGGNVLANAITHDANGMTDCAVIEEAYLGSPLDVNSAVGIWNLFAGGDPDNAVNEPTGGLHGDWEIIRIEDGRAFGDKAIALEHFFDPEGPAQLSSQSLHFVPGQNKPNLNDGDQGFGRYISRIWHTGADGTPQIFQAEFDWPIHAVSAALMKQRVWDQWTVNPGVGAGTDLILTFPTKSFYTDPVAASGFGTVAPFTAGAFRNGQACETILSEHWNREEIGGRETADGFSPPSPPGTRFELCFETNVVSIGSDTSVLESSLLRETFPVSADFRNGHIMLEMAVTVDSTGFAPWTRLLDSTIPIAGVLGRFYGLPVVGFSVRSRLNENVGIGAAYSTAFQSTYTDCVISGDPLPSNTQPVSIPSEC